MKIPANRMDRGYFKYQNEFEEKALSVLRSGWYVLGNEVKGIEQKIVDMCDAAIEIPQFGTKHSLNVSVATGIVIWDFFKQIKQNI